MKTRGKWVVIITAGAAVLVIVLPAVLLRRQVLEEWYIWRLGSSQEKVRLEAIERLGELTSVRAIPHLWKLVPRDRALFDSDEASALTSAIDKIGRPGVPTFIQVARGGSNLDRFFALDYILLIGPSGEDLPFLMESLNVEPRKPWSRAVIGKSAIILGKIGQVAHPATPDLEKVAVHGEDDSVRSAATQALELIRAAPRGQ
jgi:hypothetical protein